MATKLGIGLVGAGRQGSIHAHIIAHLVREARLVAIADRRQDIGAQLADELGVDKVYPSVEEMVRSPRVDAVLVATPSNAHVEAVEAAAASGKDVLCEKPLALTIEDTDRAINAAAGAGIRLQIGLMRRWDPDYRRARQRIAAGSLGRPTLFKSTQLDADPAPPGYLDPVLSGGLFVDMGIHDFDLARWLLDDEIEQVYAVGATLVDERLGIRGDVDTAVVTLRFRSGTLGTVQFSRKIAYGEDVRTEVAGPRGSVFVGTLPMSSGAIGTSEGIGFDAKLGSIPRFQTALEEQARGWVRTILTDSPIEVTGADSRAALIIALAAGRSVVEGRPVDIVEIGATT